MIRLRSSTVRRIHVRFILLLLPLTGLVGEEATGQSAQAPATIAPGSMAAQRAALIERLVSEHNLSPAQESAVRAIFARSPWMGQGNPAITQHPMTPQQCTERVGTRFTAAEDSLARAVCGGPHMAPLYDPVAGQTAKDAETCIDRYEFPDIPCDYPVTWVRASEAAQLCSAMGKRLCDAHEWEGACEGRLTAPDYRFDLAAGQTPAAAVAAMRKAHNLKYGADKRWSYGDEYRKGVCGAASTKSAQCTGGDWALCGSNTYPAGAFPECRSALGVYDINGNAAEHMNLPLAPGQMSSAADTPMGVTEMKGSWFIFDKIYAHEDWCRWRAPYWHGGRVMDARSHHNYHLGFRCCSTVKPAGA